MSIHESILEVVCLCILSVHWAARVSSEQKIIKGNAPTHMTAGIMATVKFAKMSLDFLNAGGLAPMQAESLITTLGSYYHKYWCCNITPNGALLQFRVFKGHLMLRHQIHHENHCHSCSLIADPTHAHQWPTSSQLYPDWSCALSHQRVDKEAVIGQDWRMWPLFPRQERLGWKVRPTTGSTLAAAPPTGTRKPRRGATVKSPAAGHSSIDRLAWPRVLLILIRQSDNDEPFPPAVAVLHTERMLRGIWPTRLWLSPYWNCLEGQAK